MSQVSEPVDLATTIRFNSGTGCVVVPDAPVCDVSVSQGAEGARDTCLLGCGVRNCGEPAGIASPPDTGSRCFSAALLVGVELAPSTGFEVVAVVELTPASKAILLAEGSGAVVPGGLAGMSSSRARPPRRARLCCLARSNRFFGFSRARGSRRPWRPVGVDAYREGPACSNEIGIRELTDCIGICLETVAGAADKIGEVTNEMEMRDLLSAKLEVSNRRCGSIIRFLKFSSIERLPIFKTDSTCCNSPD